jgi:hypothetical protein
LSFASVHRTAENRRRRKRTSEKDENKTVQMKKDIMEIRIRMSKIRYYSQSEDFVKSFQRILRTNNAQSELEIPTMQCIIRGSRDLSAAINKLFRRVDCIEQELKARRKQKEWDESLRDNPSCVDQRT